MKIQLRETANKKGFTGRMGDKYLYMFKANEEKQSMGFFAYVLIFDDEATFNQKVAGDRVDAHGIFSLKTKSNDRGTWISGFYKNDDEEVAYWITLYPNGFKGPDVENNYDYTLIFKDAEYQQPNTDKETPF